MGAPMTLSLLKAGYTGCVFDLDTDAPRLVADGGVQAAASAEDGSARVSRCAGAASL